MDDVRVKICKAWLKRHGFSESNWKIMEREIDNGYGKTRFYYVVNNNFIGPFMRPNTPPVELEKASDFVLQATDQFSTTHVLADRIGRLTGRGGWAQSILSDLNKEIDDIEKGKVTNTKPKVNLAKAVLSVDGKKVAKWSEEDIWDPYAISNQQKDSDDEIQKLLDAMDADMSGKNWDGD